MSRPPVAYAFAPWMRRGLATRAAGGAAPGRQRAGFDVRLRIDGDGLEAGPVSAEIAKRVELYGPGDITGLQPRAIVRTEPRDRVSDFEPNLMAQIEFYDEALPWLYSPAPVEGAGQRLRPWITLVVLAESEFKEARAAQERPAGFVELLDASVLPPLAESWAWAHVHVSGAMIDGVRLDDPAATAQRLAGVAAENRDRAFSRLLCARRLEANVAYHAFVVPAFESGRLAALGLDPATAPGATHGAWDNYPSGPRPEPPSFPYYLRWRFRTGPVGDFEHLVRVLEPRPVDPRVGRRDLDVARPGSGLPAIMDAPLAGVIGLPGALQPPQDGAPAPETQPLKAYDALAYPQPFQRATAKFVNLQADYTERGVSAAHGGAAATLALGPDPIITPPIYGAWHARRHRLLELADGAPAPNRDNWLHELNLDPRWRAAAGFGAKVMRENQEAYMDAAWAQVGDLRQSVHRFRLSWFARSAATSLYARTFASMASETPGHYSAVVAPVLARLRGAQSLTLRANVEDSRVPLAALSASARRLTRPQGRLAKRLAFTPAAPVHALVERINAGVALPAPPKIAPPGSGLVTEISDAVRPHDPSGGLFSWLYGATWRLLLLAFLLALIALLAFLFVGVAAALAVLAAGAGAYAAYAQWRRKRAAADDISERGFTPAAVDALPLSPNFRFVEGDAPMPAPGTGFRDSPEAVRFKRGLKSAYALIEQGHVRGAEPLHEPLNLSAFAASAHASLAPSLTVRRWLNSGVRMPDWVMIELDEDFLEPMAYPRIDIPMYAPLRDISAELLIPNLNLIPRNTITLMETNQRFIESYMAGVNHECGRELLWREYPTDQRGTPFRQFWDPTEAIESARAPASGEDARDPFYDIPPMHRWALASRLGAHDHRQTGGAPREELVLVIRGDLLKRYPNAVIYAQKAQWPTPLVDGKPDRSKERELVALTEAEAAAEKPPRDKVRTPLYSAKIDPDVTCLGFDLTDEEARGGPGESASDPAGWFFVIEERAGEPRFGADVSRVGALNVWNDLCWDDIAPAGARYVKAGAGAPTLPLLEPHGLDAEKRPQWLDDRAISWSATTHAGEIAYMLFQAPVRVAVHAEKMLPPRAGGGA